MSFTRLRYHIVFATKERRRFMKKRLRPDIYAILEEIAESQGGKTLEVGCVDDHVHIVPAIPPDVAVESFTKELKRQSSIQLKQVDPSLADFRWQSGYGAFTTSRWDMEGVLEYVRNQEEHHRRGSLREFLEQWQ